MTSDDEKRATDTRSPAKRLVRKVLVSIAGFTVLGAGVVMIATPGPGLAVILAGLAILAAEYGWARRWLRKARETGSFLWARMKGGNATEAPQAPSMDPVRASPAELKGSVPSTPQAESASDDSDANTTNRSSLHDT